MEKILESEGIKKRLIDEIIGMKGKDSISGNMIDILERTIKESSDIKNALADVLIATLQLTDRLIDKDYNLK